MAKVLSHNCSNSKVSPAGYADGGMVKLNTFRSNAEKQVDKMYGPLQSINSTLPAGGPSKRAKQIEDATDENPTTRN